MKSLYQLLLIVLSVICASTTQGQSIIDGTRHQETYRLSIKKKRSP